MNPSTDCSIYCRAQRWLASRLLIKASSSNSPTGNRIAALENKVELLNGNIKALNILCRDGLIISKVEHNATDGIYTLTLSDGTILKLAEKVDGFGTTPLVSIDKDGFWQVSYDSGKSFTPILKDGDVPARAAGGVSDEEVKRNVSSGRSVPAECYPIVAPFVSTVGTTCFIGMKHFVSTVETTCFKP